MKKLIILILVLFLGTLVYGAECDSCLGDLNRDGWLSPQDVWYLIHFIEEIPEWAWPEFRPYDPCGDLNGDTWITPQDVWALIAPLELKPEWGYWIQCGDPLIPDP